MKQKDAFEILKQGNNVLLTGAAGSGKTYLLEKFGNWAKSNNKNVAMTATTGIAATNINGKTIHNYSNLGISGRDILENEAELIRLANGMRLHYRNAVMNTNILVIDEISMLHDYQLNAVDKIIRTVRNNDSPFGGLQVVLCGDFFQLPPIPENNEQSRFIIQSPSYINGIFKVCYFEECWRQNKDDPLITVLNAIRSNQLTDAYLDLLENRINAKLSVQNFTKLYCTNINVYNENQRNLDEIPIDSKCYQWQENGENYELERLKNDLKNKVKEKLELKVGANVMFLKNNLRLGYSNGSMGKVVSFDDRGYPNIQLNDGRTLTSIQQDDFYREDEKGNRLATIRQIPLKLAWAITIHKSQGMTLDNAMIDLTNAFTPGLGYVALSRVRNINNISLIGIDRPSLRKALEVSPEALNIEHELQDKSRDALNCLTNEKPDISKQVLSAENIQFITTQGINHFLYELIKNANQYVTLITPYAQLNTRLQELLKNKKQQGVTITFVCRVNELKEQEKLILSECGTHIKNRNNLHAKCYISENEAIITSLNLYEYSQVNNDEMGILVKRDHKMYDDILEEAERIRNNSDEVVITEPPLNLPIAQIEIRRVTIVPGADFNPYWRREMQRIETERGVFIDNIPRNGGFDWTLEVGHIVTGFTINEANGHRWLNKSLKPNNCGQGK